MTARDSSSLPAASPPPVSASSATTSSAASPAREEGGEGQRARRTKTIYLIRHAESNENTVYNSARRVLSSFRACSVPTMSDVRTSLTLPVRAFKTSTTDADVSEHGRNQILHLKSRIEEDGFLERSVHGGTSSNDDGRSEDENDGAGGGEIEARTVLVAHSPLLRAKRTARGIVAGFEDEENSRGDGAPATESTAEDGGRIVLDDGRIVVAYEELDCLREINPREMVRHGHGALRDRIRLFEEWIEGREEDRLVVVGHSLYFQKMLDLPFTFGNCDVWEATYSLDGGGGEEELPEENGAVEGDRSDGWEYKEADYDDGEVHCSLPRSWLRVRRLYGSMPEDLIIA